MITDKQQIIEEMVEVIGVIRPEISHENGREPTVICMRNATNKEIAEALYNAGYRKVEQDYAELLHEYECVSEGLVDAMELVHKIKAKRDVLEQQLADAHKEIDRLYKIKLDLEHQMTQQGLTEYVGADVIEEETRKVIAKKIFTNLIADASKEYNKGKISIECLKAWAIEYGVEVE